MKTHLLAHEALPGHFYPFRGFSTRAAMINANEQSIDLNAVDMDDDTYRISKTSGIDTLIESIRNVGMINFPILEPRQKSYRIVCGFKRIIACRALDFQKIRCRVIHGDCNELDALKMAIADNAVSAPLHFMEEARAVTKLRRLCPSGDNLPQTARALGLTVNRDLAEKYGRLCMLPIDLQRLVEADVITMNTAIDLGRYDEQSVLAAAGLFESLRPTASQQKELLAGLTAISKLQETDIGAVVTSSPFIDIIENTDLDRKQKIQQLRDEVRKLRYPHITRFEARFAENLKALNLQEGISLVPPRNFESPVYMFTLDFTDIGELVQKAERVIHLCEIGELNSVLTRDIEDT